MTTKRKKKGREIVLGLKFSVGVPVVAQQKRI